MLHERDFALHHPDPSVQGGFDADDGFAGLSGKGFLIELSWSPTVLDLAATMNLAESPRTRAHTAHWTSWRWIGSVRSFCLPFFPHSLVSLGRAGEERVNAASSAVPGLRHPTLHGRGAIVARSKWRCVAAAEGGGRALLDVGAAEPASPSRQAASPRAPEDTTLRAYAQTRCARTVSCGACALVSARRH